MTVMKSSSGKGAKIMGMMINVDPAKLENGSIHIEQQSMSYDKSYARLYQAIEAMRAGWQGKDNQAFTTEIESFRKDFQQMSLLMKEYASFLKASARLYRETQDERATQARHLTS